MQVDLDKLQWCMYGRVDATQLVIYLANSRVSASKLRQIAEFAKTAA